jgi:hypothetical protein
VSGRDPAGWARARVVVKGGLQRGHRRGGKGAWGSGGGGIEGRGCEAGERMEEQRLHSSSKGSVMSEAEEEEEGDLGRNGMTRT